MIKNVISTYLIILGMPIALLLTQTLVRGPKETLVPILEQTSIMGI